MKLRGTLPFLIGLVLAAASSALIFDRVVSRSARSEPTVDASFFQAVDLSPLETMTVWSEGRLESFVSHARRTMSLISGPRRPRGLRADEAYIELMLVPGAFADEPLIYVKNKPMRRDLGLVLMGAGIFQQIEFDGFVRNGLLAREILDRPEVGQLMRTWQRDVVRTAKFVDQVVLAMFLSEPQRLLEDAAVIPPASGDAGDRWSGLDALWSSSPTFSVGDDQLFGHDAAAQELLRTSFATFARAWISRDADGASSSLAALASQLSEVSPELYPSPQRMSLESLYFRAGHLTWVWLVYLVSAVLLLMATIYRWRGAAAAGFGVFSVAFALHTGVLVWRWYISGRWPNSNMFEAVTTSVWMGTAIAIAVEIMARRSAMRNLFALCGAVAAMIGLMAAHFAPQLDAGISNMAPILHDIWLYIHTNVIIASYALIAMAAISALLYLVRRMLGGPADYARAGGAASIIEESSSNGRAERSRTLGEILDGVTMVLMEIAFVMLWAGIVMGAIWADHSWGRPWGWDPKEVFALNTFLVFLILVHVRLTVRDKGMWTALLAVAGAGVMVFNWYIINFIISGLHSYA